ncbi:predicted protein [Naegleria gruberi]|uniref:Predicted protein n=1 Tax=Naegleria gruberi TaxID=5762 RepID=D2VR66_NAEGR|nr:uncharacterized protein NAEGRDRAFT_71477 [Naegleria gruberi]EFC40552.1 predicted protein [Naegleria gruberi]|eukprot:XP_002673296.1 predicted protein [Naegleria gruberi strain NEG-M]
MFPQQAPRIVVEIKLGNTVAQLFPDGSLSNGSTSITDFSAVALNKQNKQVWGFENDKVKILCNQNHVCSYGQVNHLITGKGLNRLRSLYNLVITKYLQQQPNITVPRTNAGDTTPATHDAFQKKLAELVEKFKTKYSKLRGVEFIQPVVFGSSVHGREFNEDTVKDVEIVTIYDAPSLHALQYGVAGLGETSYYDAQLASQYECLNIYGAECCFIEAIKTPCEHTFEGISYSNERSEWIELLVLQLRLFPNLRQIRVLCCKKNQNILLGNDIFNLIAAKTEVIVFMHSSPTNVMYNRSEMFNEREAKKKEGLPQPYSKDFNSFVTRASQYTAINIDLKKERSNIQNKEPSGKKTDNTTKPQPFKFERFFSSNKWKALEPTEETSNLHRDWNEVFDSREYSTIKEYCDYLTSRPGQCQFDSVLLLINEPDRNLREEVAQHIELNCDYYQEYIDEPFEQYIRKVRGNDWGDNITLRAISEVLSVRIIVVDEDEGTDDVVLGHFFEEEIVLGFVNQSHYIPLIKREHMPTYHHYGTAIEQQRMISAELTDVHETSTDGGHYDWQTSQLPSNQSTQNVPDEGQEGNSKEESYIERNPHKSHTQKKSSNRNTRKNQFNPALCVFITNLSYSSTWREIKELFDGATYVKLFKNQDSEQHKGCGYIQFKSKEQKDAALKLKQPISHNGRNIKIREYEKRNNK